MEEAFRFIGGIAAGVFASFLIGLTVILAGRFYCFVAGVSLDHDNSVALAVIAGVTAIVVAFGLVPVGIFYFAED